MIKSTNMSNPFEIAAQASIPILPSTLNPAILAPRHGPKAKPLAERRLYALQLAHHNPITTTTTNSLLAQFKANNDNDAELDSDSDNPPDIRRRSYTREQKLAAVGYATTKRVGQKGEMVPISDPDECILTVNAVNSKKATVSEPTIRLMRPLCSNHALSIKPHVPVSSPNRDGHKDTRSTMQDMWKYFRLRFPRTTR
jgi:hypothetical protein